MTGKVTKTGEGHYKVLVDGVEVFSHAQKYEAHNRLRAEQIENPNSDVVVVLDTQYQYEPSDKELDQPAPKDAVLGIETVVFIPSEPEVSEAFEVEVTVSETAGVATEGLSVSLVVDGAGINESFTLDELNNNSNTVIFSGLSIDTSGGYTAVVTVDATNAQAVNAEQAFTVSQVEEPEPGVFAAPLHNQPSAPGPHIDQIAVMQPGEWLQLPKPEADPEWGEATGCSWGTYSLVYAPSLRGAFFAGEGFHGGWGQHGPNWDETHPRWWYGLDGYFFYDIPQNKWICIYPGTPVEDYLGEFENGHWDIDWEKHHVVAVDPEPRLPARLKGSIVPCHMLIHAWGVLGYDTNRERFYHYIPGGTGPHQGKSGLRGFSELWLPGGSTRTEPVREYLKEQGYYDMAEAPSLGPVYYDTKTGKFDREPANFESYHGVAHYTYIEEDDKNFRIGRTGGGYPRFYDFETNEWGSNGPAFVVKGTDIPMAYDPTRRRAYTGPGAGSFADAVNDHFRYYDFDLNEWVQPNPVPENEPPFTNWGNNRVFMHYNPVSDRILLFDLYSLASYEDRKVYVYSIEDNAWEAPVEIPSSLWEGAGNHRQPHAFYDADQDVYYIFVSRDSKDDWSVWVYKYGVGEPEPDPDALYEMELVNYGN